MVRILDCDSKYASSILVSRPNNLFKHTDKGVFFVSRNTKGVFIWQKMIFIK